MEFNKKWNLSCEKQKELGREFIKGRDLKIKNLLIKANLQWCNKLARKWINIPIEDAISVANITLCQAVDTWDPDKGCLTTYLNSAIKFAMLGYLRDSNNVLECEIKYEPLIGIEDSNEEIWSLMKDKLTNGEFFIMESIFLLGLKETEIAKEIGLTPQWVNKVKKKCLNKLKTDIDIIQMIKS